MFDTVRLQTDNVGLSAERLKRAGWMQRITREMDKTTGEMKESSHWRLQRDASPHFLQYSPDDDTLIVETSLPKVIYGDNIQMLKPADVPRALGELTNRVADAVQDADIPDCALWRLRGRADAVFSWDVGGRVRDYLHAYKSLGLPRHHSQAVDVDATLYWKNGERTIRMYDKHCETKDDAARGLLRFEIQPRRARAELGTLADAPAVHALTWKNAHRVLSKHLEALGGSLIVTDEERLFKRLRDAYGPTKALRLMGHVLMATHYGRDELMAMGVNRSTIWRAATQVKKAGANATTAKTGLLPSLQLPAVGDYAGEPVRLK